MKYVYCLLATLVLGFVSCSNKKHPSEYYPSSSSSYAISFSSEYRETFNPNFALTFGRKISFFAPTFG